MFLSLLICDIFNLFIYSPQYCASGFYYHVYTQSRRRRLLYINFLLVLCNVLSFQLHHYLPSIVTAISEVMLFPFGLSVCKTASEVTRNFVKCLELFIFGKKHLVRFWT